MDGHSFRTPWISCHFTWDLMSSCHEARVSRKKEESETNMVSWWDSKQGDISHSQVVLSRRETRRELESDPGPSALVHISPGHDGTQCILVRCCCKTWDPWRARLCTLLPNSTFNKIGMEISKNSKSAWCHHHPELLVNTCQHTTGHIASLWVIVSPSVKQVEGGNHFKTPRSLGDALGEDMEQHRLGLNSRGRPCVNRGTFSSLFTSLSLTFFLCGMKLLTPAPLGFSVH